MHPVQLASGPHSVPKLPRKYPGSGWSCHSSSDLCLMHCLIPSTTQALALNSLVEQFPKLSNTNMEAMTSMTLNQGEREWKEMKLFHDQSIKQAKQGRDEAAQLLPDRWGRRHFTTGTQTNTLSTPVLYALLNFPANRGLRDYLVQPPHFSDEKTKVWKH